MYLINARDFTVGGNVFVHKWAKSYCAYVHVAREARTVRGMAIGRPKGQFLASFVAIVNRSDTVGGNHRKAFNLHSGHGGGETGDDLQSGGIEIVYAQHEAGFLDNLGLLDSVAQIAVAEPVLPRAVKDDSLGHHVGYVGMVVAKIGRGVHAGGVFLHQIQHEDGTREVALTVAHLSARVGAVVDLPLGGEGAGHHLKESLVGGGHIQR